MRDATWMVCTFKFEAGKPHEDPVDIDAWIFVLRAVDIRVEVRGLEDPRLL
jgi:hypothetical protein